MDTSKKIGVAIRGRNTPEVIERTEQAEQMGVPAVWLTVSGAGGDAITHFAAAAVRTERILLGTSIAIIWSRHPVTMAQQARVLAELAPGRFRLGVGPGHIAGMVRTFGAPYRAPLGHLREYIRVLKAMLQQGVVDFDGAYYQAHAQAEVSLDVPVMASALRRRSFELCGAEADGAISWVCPVQYLRDVAMPAMRAGAEQAGRAVPPLIAHAPVCVHDNVEEVRAAVREQLGNYPVNPFYTQMFVDAGFPEVVEVKGWSDRMIDAVVFGGDEARVRERLLAMLSLGPTEILVSPVLAGQDREASMQRTLRLVAEVSGPLST